MSKDRVPVTKPKTVYRCDLCGTVMQDIHCKLVCPQCGYTRDCTDP